MPLLMLDLDNTLVDRDAAFRDATAGFLTEHALPESDIEWLMSIDASGYTPRQAVAQAMTDRYGASLPESAIRILLDHGAADRIVLPEPTRDALADAIADGWSCTIVTNGRTVQQEAKIRNTGLDKLVHGWAISEEVGHKKPGPEIFKAAASAVGASLQGAWVIGDSPQADIAGANGLDVRSVWVSGGRPWTEAAYRPTHVANDAASAIRYVIGTPTRG
ncbi:HAD family hydrolase [Streptosporangium sp. NBC_01756]|uniref:HAD family hydrolase n=1 Tax=Streptosporangium sp. NBC_01756 TaxID=2975950 RepID=UPI002DD96CFC|nr:HAD family hydrolase [Streptosporangium sp. NBC_01756]WSC86472.1 HAD family hydrolase [Streptosporangium sp. NBC_01756]